MIHHGFGIPHEYFHYLHAAIIGPRFGIDTLRNGWLLQSDGEVRRAYIKELINRRTLNGIFSAKIQWWEFVSFLDNPEGVALFQNAKFIHLYREDLLAQAISLHISQETGRWGFDHLITTPSETNPNFLHSRQIDSYLEEIASHDMHWRMFFARNQILPLTVSYECLTDDPSQVLRSMVNAFSLEVSTSDFGYTEERSANARDPRVPPLSEIKAHLLRAHKQLSQAARGAKKTRRMNKTGRGKSEISVRAARLRGGT
jgi:LPS sulfotransferase NodH